MHIDSLKPRNKRSLDFIGSAWKQVAVNPDHADFEIIEQKINNVLESNTRQVIITRMSLEKLNELTSKSNRILKSVISEESRNYLINKLKYKLEIIKDEILSLKYAINLSKNEMDLIRTIVD